MYIFFLSVRSAEPITKKTKCQPSTSASVEIQWTQPTNLGRFHTPVAKLVENYFNQIADTNVFFSAIQDPVLLVQKLSPQNASVAKNQLVLVVATPKNGVAGASVEETTKPATTAVRKNATKKNVLHVPKMCSLPAIATPKASLDLATNPPGFATNPVVVNFPARYISVKVFVTNPETVKAVPLKKTEHVHVEKRNTPFHVNRNLFRLVVIPVVSF